MTIVTAPVTGNVWKIEVAEGDAIAEEDVLIIIESMKMEIPVEAEEHGTVAALLCREGDSVTEGDALLELSS